VVRSQPATNITTPVVTFDSPVPLLRLPRKLRDDIYAYLTPDEDFWLASPPVVGKKKNAIFEYTTRLQHRIKRLEIDHMNSVVTPRIVLWHGAMSPYASSMLLIAERKVSINAWVQDDVVLQWKIPFKGISDDVQQ
jgi:hypothetical protein